MQRMQQKAATYVQQVRHILHRRRHVIQVLGRLQLLHHAEGCPDD